jgi:hypothetical protein
MMSLKIFNMLRKSMKNYLGKFLKILPKCFTFLCSLYTMYFTHPKKYFHRFHTPNLSGPYIFFDLPSLIHRSFDPHMGGAFVLTRVFGGQSLAQSYLVGRKLFPAHCINKLEITFLGPGNYHCSY